ncbi:Armadillo [Cynara cardunculus var. scolymus]|uniref:RING-type E3 ubiquitin transferase n=1 Tax=Cynara cardunculus var. scolymus TaxID=59895 RepID=A0A118K4K2_CYNCS|nr:Armadillo [Cynara cardunculus var. scolymus]
MSTHVPASGTLSRAISTTLETVHSTKATNVQKENFKKLSSYLERITFILQESTKLDIHDSGTLKNTINVLTKHVSEANIFAHECSNKNKIYLLLNCKKIVKSLENHTKEIGNALNLLHPLISVNGLDQDIIKLSKIMLNANYQESATEEEIIEKIKVGIRERNVDRSYANSLLVSIADVIGISTEQAVLRKEYEEFKHEMENVELTEDVAEALQIEQTVALLGKADIISTAEEREKKYFSKRNSLGRQPLEPLQSFYCPITQELMDDPVETPSGHSFERYAIEKWLAVENNLCPITKTPLKASALRTNKTLRQSIEESCILTILRILATDNDDRKESIAKTDNAIKLIVCSLARKIEESKLALQLLMELSENDVARNIIGSSQGCILLLVTLSGSDDAQAAEDAKQLLENLSFLHQNIVQMANANHFGPLLRLLSSGSESVQRVMAETLSEVEMTDHAKLTVCENGAVESLVAMLSHINIEMKKAAILALEKLSGVPQNGLKMMKQGVVEILFGILFRESLSMPNLVEKVVATIVNLALSLTSHKGDHEDTPFLESEEDIFKLFSLISLYGPNVQQNVLRTFLAVCQSPSDGDDETFVEHVGSKCIETLLRIVNISDNIEEGIAVMEIISSLPRTPQMTQWIVDAGTLQAIISILSSRIQKPELMIESASGALCRFTISTNQELQKKVAETGIIPTLVQLLDYGSPLTKQNVAISLAQFSESSNNLSGPVVRKSHFFSCCVSTPDTSCTVHSGICTIESSFCLLEANAVTPLAKVLDEPDFGAVEASLDALLTLVNNELLQKGSKVLESGDAIVKMVKLLSSPSVKLQEKALIALERIFRQPEYKQKYKTTAHMALVEITQRGSHSMKSLAAKILAHLNVLHEQSSFF